MVGVIFVTSFIYVNTESSRQNENRHISFANMNLSMSRVTTNYLDGERNVCGSWAKHLNEYVSTIEDAITFVRSAKSVESAIGQIVYKDTLKGLSTNASSTDSTDFTVDYSSYQNLFDVSTEETIKITHSYTNPISGNETIACFAEISLIDPNDASKTVPAYLLRTIPIEELNNKWVFPNEEFESNEISLISSDGNYIIKGYSFKNNNFFEFYKSYNDYNSQTIAELQESVNGESGHFWMYNSKHQKCVIAHSKIESTDDWVILSYILFNEIDSNQFNWTIVMIIAIGLITLLLFDIVVFLLFNKNLKDAAMIAEKANRAKTDFLSTMSHDIRTPMNAIIGLTNITKKEIDDPQLVKENLKKIELASNHLLTLINDILDISRVESNKVVINPVPFSISEVVENLVNITESSMEAKHLNYSINVHNFINENLFSDKLRLNQIFINILSNAIKYTNENGSIKVDFYEKTSAKPGYIRLIYVVEDTGIGMSKEFLERMYEPFSRETDARVNKIEGTGLGLAITKKMVEILSGTIECQSEVGKGTKFTISIDIEVDKEKTEDYDLPQANILIYSQDRQTIESIATYFFASKIKCEFAESKEQLIQLNRNGNFDAILVEWLPETIKQLGDNSQTIVMSYNWTSFEKKAKDLGVNHFINKPIFKSTLSKALTSVLLPTKESFADKDDEHEFEDLNILIAEDNEINWEVISTLLSSKGAKTYRAENGKVAVEMIKNKNVTYDLVFMDIQMPVMNGLEATKQIRKIDDDYARNIPIIAMTADAFSENVAECFRAGMNAHISKPIDINIVFNEIRKIKESK